MDNLMKALVLSTSDNKALHLVIYFIMFTWLVFAQGDESEEFVQRF